MHNAWRCFMIALLAHSPVYAAPSVHKCIDSDGNTRYQETACQASGRTEQIHPDVTTKAPGPDGVKMPDQACMQVYESETKHCMPVMGQSQSATQQCVRERLSPSCAKQYDPQKPMSMDKACQNEFSVASMPCGQKLMDRYKQCVYERLDRSCVAQIQAAEKSAMESMTRREVSSVPADSTLPADDRLKSCHPASAIKAAREILNDPKSLKEPATMFPAAQVLFDNGEKDDAVFWFYAAQLRARYQLVFEKGDRGQILSIMMTTVGQPINNYALQDTTRLDRILDKVLRWDNETPNILRERPRTSENEADIEKIYSGLRDLKKKLITERNDLQQKAKDAAPQIERLSAMAQASRCRPGQPDPSQTRLTIKMEEKEVAEYVGKHAQVQKEAGPFASVNVASYSLKGGSQLPGRYTVSVSSRGKTIYAEVDVSRSANGASFTLLCTTNLWLGQREAGKDVCAK